MIAGKVMIENVAVRHICHSRVPRLVPHPPHYGKGTLFLNSYLKVHGIWAIA